MTIKRYIYEEDDQVDQRKQTVAPDILLGSNEQQALSPSTINHATGQTNFDIGSSSENTTVSDSASESTGRTFPDLIHMYINKPHFMLVAFTIISFIILRPTNASWLEFQKPLLLALILSLVWYLAIFVVWLVKLIKK